MKRLRWGVKISRDFAEKMALLPIKNERIAIKSLEILSPLSLVGTLPMTV
jgi:hypothetical protein